MGARQSAELTGVTREQILLVAQRAKAAAARKAAEAARSAAAADNGGATESKSAETDRSRTTEAEPTASATPGQARPAGRSPLCAPPVAASDSDLPAPAANAVDAPGRSDVATTVPRRSTSEKFKALLRKAGLGPRYKPRANAASSPARAAAPPGPSTTAPDDGSPRARVGTPVKGDASARFNTMTQAEVLEALLQTGAVVLKPPSFRVFTFRDKGATAARERYHRTCAALELTYDDVKRLYRFFARAAVTQEDSRIGLNVFCSAADIDRPKVLDRIVKIVCRGQRRMDFRAWVVVTWQLCTLDRDDLVKFLYRLYNDAHTTKTPTARLKRDKLDVDDVRRILLDVNGHSPDHVQNMLSEESRELLYVKKAGSKRMPHRKGPDQSRGGFDYIEKRDLDHEEVIADIGALLERPGDAPVSLAAWELFCRARPSLMYPMFAISKNMRMRVLGMRFWRKLTDRRTSSRTPGLHPDKFLEFLIRLDAMEKADALQLDKRQAGQSGVAGDALASKRVLRRKNAGRVKYYGASSVGEAITARVEDVRQLEQERKQLEEVEKIIGLDKVAEHEHADQEAARDRSGSGSLQRMLSGGRARSGSGDELSSSRHSARAIGLSRKELGMAPSPRRDEATPAKGLAKFKTAARFAIMANRGAGEGASGGFKTPPRSMSARLASGKGALGAGGLSASARSLTPDEFAAKFGGSAPAPPASDGKGHSLTARALFDRMSGSASARQLGLSARTLPTSRTAPVRSPSGPVVTPSTEKPLSHIEKAALRTPSLYTFGRPTPLAPVSTPPPLTAHIHTGVERRAAAAGAGVPSDGAAQSGSKSARVPSLTARGRLGGKVKLAPLDPTQHRKNAALFDRVREADKAAASDSSDSGSGSHTGSAHPSGDDSSSRASPLASTFGGVTAGAAAAAGAAPADPFAKFNSLNAVRTPSPFYGNTVSSTMLRDAKLHKEAIDKVAARDEAILAAKLRSEADASSHQAFVTSFT